MKTRETTKIIEVEGRTFAISKFAPYDGFYIAKLLGEKILPAFQDFMPLIRNFMNSGSAADFSPEGVIENLKFETIANALSKVRRDDLKYITEISLKQVREKLKAGLAPVLNDNGSYGVLDLEGDTVVILRLVCEAVAFGVGDFLDVSRLTSVMKPMFSSLTRNPQT